MFVIITLLCVYSWETDCSGSHILNSGCVERVVTACVDAFYN